MHTHTDKTPENKSQAVAAVSPKQRDNAEPAFADNNPEAAAQIELQAMANNSAEVQQLKAFGDMANNSPDVQQLKAFGDIANNSPHVKQLKAYGEIVNSAGTIQRKGNPEEELLQGKFQPGQKRENNTGLPDTLKSGIEHLSGMDISDIKVHYNSGKPAEITQRMRSAGDLASLVNAHAAESVLQGAFFTQPSSEEHKVLGTKCYAFAVFNALARAGRTPEIEGVAMTRQQVEAWIIENEAGTMGGGPAVVAKKMNESFGFMRVGRSQRTAVRTALANHLPVAIGIVIGVKPADRDERARHYIYATGTTADAIQAEDQQNTHYGILNFTKQDGKWVWLGPGGKPRYEITQIEIGHDNQDPDEYDKISKFY